MLIQAPQQRDLEDQQLIIELLTAQNRELLMQIAALQEEAQVAFVTGYRQGLSEAWRKKATLKAV